MALKAQHGVVRRHAAAVVDDLDERTPGIGHHYLDVRCSGIHRILHELFHYRGRSLNDLPGSNHVGNIFR